MACILERFLGQEYSKITILLNREQKQYKENLANSWWRDGYRDASKVYDLSVA